MKLYFWDEIFSMPIHGFLIYYDLIIFQCLLFETQNIFDAPPPTIETDPPPPPAIIMNGPL